MEPLTVFTIGHSTRPIGEFVRLLQSNGLEQIIDIRTIPKSRFNPQFGSGELAASLQANGIEYVHLKELGGLRRARPDSGNLGWRNGGFRGFADYMQTPEFGAAVERAIQLATLKRSALMCAGGRAVAMPSFTRRRRADYSRHSRRGHCERCAAEGA